jgi:hypothetical protein
MISLTAGTVLFATHEAERAYTDEIQRLIWAGELQAAEDVLLDDLLNLDHPIADICRATTLDHIGWNNTYGGWNAVNEMIARGESRHKPFTALGIDLSNHGDPPKNPEGWQEPYIEVSFYSDAYFPFSATDNAELLVQMEKSSTPWQGCFEEIESMLLTIGLAQLHSAIELINIANCQSPKKQSVENDSVILGSIFRTLRFHQAVKRHIENTGIAKMMPVIVGSNEMSPFFDAPYISRKMDKPPVIAAPVKPEPKTAQPKLSPDQERRIMREELLAVSGARLRQRINQNSDENGESSSGIFGKLFGR